MAAPARSPSDANLPTFPAAPCTYPIPSSPFQALRQLVSDCWHTDPESRPSFEDIVNRLEDMLKTMPKHSPYTAGGGAGGCCSVQ